MFGLALGTALAAGALLGFGAETARAAGQVKMGMLGGLYGPKAVKAKVGDSIVFDNDDGENHWVYISTPGFMISKAGIKPGEKFEVKLLKPGTFTVQCGLHKDMSATLTVER
jgi:plastocyanin